jgi:hypothetical protein
MGNFRQDLAQADCLTISGLYSKSRRKSSPGWLRVYIGWSAGLVEILLRLMIFTSFGALRALSAQAGPRARPIVTNRRAERLNRGLVRRAILY